MNEKARQLGMRNTRFFDSTGLNSSNVSTAHDLALLVNAGYQYPMIREFTASGFHHLALIDSDHQTVVAFRNTNALLRNSRWEIGLSKTGYINEAGRCLVMQATIATKAVMIVLLHSQSKAGRMADANRIKHWLERPDIATRKTKERLGVLYQSLSVTLAFLAGLFCIACSFFKLGGLADFLSRPILVGFLNGIALSIVLGQLGKVFGFNIDAGRIIPHLLEFASKPHLTVAIRTGRASS